MAVRNFYVEADIDGRQTILGGGPRNSTGEMTVHIHQRNNEGIESDVVKIVCTEHQGQLRTCVYVDGKCIHTHITVR